jgi:aryl-phospho-beta-D-glucosidase BglC (GH1 family)
MTEMLQIKNSIIVDEQGQPVRLRGIALGGWLMMEGYMLGGENMAEHKLKANLITEAGPTLANEFNWEFRKRFFNQADVKRIKEFGFNCVRIPFNYRLLRETSPDGKTGIEYLQEVVRWFAQEQIYVILDMHAVPGSQNKDWHSDSDGVANFFSNSHYRNEFVNLWRSLSFTFKNEPWIAGYDIINEPVTERTDLLVEVFNRVTNALRKSGDNHIIFLEGNNWAREVAFLKDCIKANVAYSIHFYEPGKFVFQEDRSLSYPGIVDGKKWDKKAVFDYLEPYSKLNAPIYVGEFGVSSFMTNYQWVKDALEAFEQFDFHWTYWTYKSAAKVPFPDGFYQNFDKKGVFAMGAEHAGFKNIGKMLMEKKEQFYDQIETKSFQLNEPLAAILK